jgi:glutamate N-acetyltransferase/amino-acid N-acetyltransferase
MRSRGLTEQICLPKGFAFSAACAGIKVSGRPDLAFVEAASGTTAAALFTRNQVTAAPLQVGRAILEKTGGHLRAVIVNSGNANCATGKPGIRAAQRVCASVARLLKVKHEEVFPSSTGIIGVPLPTEKILAHLPALLSARTASETGVDQFASAIMTTDTRPKTASASFCSSTSTVNLLGIAKGSGMIHPQLATMLVYLFTDIVAQPAELRRTLKLACADTFERISVDGDTSTNDTVLLLASGQSAVHLKSVQKTFAASLSKICQSLANQIIRDGEGVQHIIHLTVDQAKTRAEALQVARAIAHSLLVKTAWAGADPNWGRILAAAGYSGVPIDPEKVSIFIAKQMVCRNGAAHAFNETQAHRDLSQPNCDIRVRLGRGRSSVAFITTDLTAEYVRINADYST